MTIVRYAGVWWDGTDVALIAIPPIKPSPGCKVFDIWESTSNFFGYNKKWKEAKSCAIVGFPLIKKYVIFTIGVLFCDSLRVKRIATSLGSHLQVGME